MTETIDFYFEFASPYGYLASLEVDNLAAKYGRSVNWRPFMLGAILKITNSAPMMTIPIKGDYMYRDVARCAKLMGVPLTKPDVAPMNSLAAMRVFYWLLDQDKGKAVSFAKAIYHAYWGAGRDMSPVDSVLAVVSDLGVDPSAARVATQDAAVKEQLKRETQLAIDRGAFGSPFIFVDDEGYWGHDRMHHIEHHLRHGGI